MFIRELFVFGLALLATVDARPPRRSIQKRLTNPTVSGWSYVGCVKDSSARALTGTVKTYSAMTVEYCLAYCAASDYTYAGLEANNQCYCDTALRNSMGYAVTESTCDDTCTGNTAEACGGSWRLSLYKATTTTSSTSKASTSTSTSTAKSSTTTSQTSTTTKASSTSTSATTTGSAAAESILTSVSGGTWQGCYKDNGTNRTLSSSKKIGDTITPSVCISYCSGLGYSYAGVEYYNECYCGSTLDSSKKDVDTKCEYACTADSSQYCGGDTRLGVYLIGSSTTSAKTTTSTTKTSTSTSSTSTTSTTSTSTASAASHSSTSGVASVPSSTSTKYLYAHHMVGNTYSYEQTTWADDISQAYAAGIDGFALNYGSDSWQTSRIASAYAAAKSQGSFKLFLSLDFSSLSCSSTSDATTHVSTISTYASNSAQATYNGSVLLSSFEGEACTFGQSSVAEGWAYVRSLLTAKSISIYFVPAIFSDTSTFSSDTWIQGEFNWNGGWPMSSTALDTSSDTTYRSALGSKTYMAAISPCFFTYYSPSSYNKDWIYRSDDWLLARRMEQVISMRASIDLAEIISWNDYGESHYIGPIRTDQPDSEGWTDGMPHIAWLEVVSYYATAFKTGSYGSAGDQMVFWSRPHPKAATPSSPTTNRPTNWNYTDDNLYVWVCLKAAATVTIYSGDNTVSFSAAAGVNKFSVASDAGIIGGTITRDGSTMRSYSSSGSFTYTTTPTDYNYNYFVASAS